ncbi:(d)CMP kinase [Atopococcus tabaci]|uniref:(d)CMP kinase n=1 Tax=Atopococcus tabaci TaxID=269774 RepID=UPI000428F876|nr:(d)CMP kinase [Atopococcus tabaci]
MEKMLSIAVDGPASSGKSTVSKKVAKDLGLIYIDTGAMYRTLTYEALKRKADIENEEELLRILEDLSIRFERNGSDQKVYANETEVTEVIRNADVTNSVSIVSAHPKIREVMVERQREMAQKQGVIMDGRDIGTVVLPKADVKIFLIASVEERAMRRFKENQSRGITTSLEDLTREIEERDYKDSNREVAPLKQASDAHLIDTTGLSIPEVVEKIKEIAFSK